MITCPTTGLARHVRVRRLVRATLLTAALALAASPFAHPAVARADPPNPDFYKWCMQNLTAGMDYCCAHAGGVVKDGKCGDPVTGNPFPLASAVMPG
jgi:hypothetical protein